MTPSTPPSKGSDGGAKLSKIMLGREIEGGLEEDTLKNRVWQQGYGLRGENEGRN